MNVDIKGRCVCITDSELNSTGIRMLIANARASSPTAPVMAVYLVGDRELETESLKNVSKALAEAQYVVVEGTSNYAKKLYAEIDGSMLKHFASNSKVMAAWLSEGEKRTDDIIAMALPSNGMCLKLGRD